MRTRWPAAALLGAALASGCGGLGNADAEKLVRTYLARVAEAYRASDAEIAGPLVGDEQAKKLLGLIGVKRDAGITLDAQLLEVRFERFSRGGGEVLVDTRERWYYRDRRIGSGEQVGADSTDAYHVRYHLARPKDRWVVERLEFLDPPEVGRKSAPVTTDVRVLHGMLAPPQTPSSAPASAPGERR